MDNEIQHENNICVYQIYNVANNSYGEAFAACDIHARLYEDHMLHIGKQDEFILTKIANESLIFCDWCLEGERMEKLNDKTQDS